MTYRTKMWALAALAIGTAAIAGVVIGKTVPSDSGVENPALVLPALLVVAGLVMAAAVPWWRKTDDLQKQGQLLSWWWGGNFGALVMLVTLVVMTGRHSDVSMGAGYLFMAQVAGMGVAYLLWKFHGRGLSE